MERLPELELLDRQSRNLRGVINTGLRDLDYLPGDHFSQGVIAILDAEKMQRSLVSVCDAADLFRLQ